MQKVWDSGNYTCKKYRISQNCYKFSPKDHNDMKTFFKSFPVFSFNLGGNSTFKWFPSEYFYKNSTNKYCLAIDPYGGGSRMIIGGSMMRQYLFLFDMEKNTVGTVRSRCSNDPNMFVYDDSKYLNPSIPVENNSGNESNSKNNSTPNSETNSTTNPETNSPPNPKPNEEPPNITLNKTNSEPSSPSPGPEINPFPIDPDPKTPEPKDPNTWEPIDPDDGIKTSNSTGSWVNWENQTDYKVK